MITRITPIMLNERSAAVANLQAGMQMLGLPVAAAELNTQRAGETTAQHIREFQKRMNITPKEGFLIDDVTADAINNMLREQGVALGDEGSACWVRGVVRGAGRTPVRDLVVTAFDQDLRTRQELGRCPTRNDGEYLIYYDRSKIKNAELGGADMVLQVSGPNGEVLHVSDVQFNVPETFNFDIQLSKAPSEAEFDMLLRLVRPLIEGQDVTLATLEESDKYTDVSFLAGETGQPRERLTVFVIAQRLAREGLPAEFWYATLRSGVVVQPLPPPTGWPSLDDAAKATLAKAVAVAPSTVEGGLKAAVTQQTISEKAGGSIEAWMRSFRALAAAGTGAAASGRVAGVQKTLELAGLPADKRQAVLNAYLEAPSRAEAIDRLRKDKVLDARQLQAVDTHLALNDMTLGDTELAATLISSRRIDPQDPQALRKVARLSASDWEQTFKQAGIEAPAYLAGDTPDKKRENYAKLLGMQFQRAFPTAAFAAGLERDLKTPRGDSGGQATKAMGRQAPKLLQFLDDNPAFELAATGVDRYLKEKAGPGTIELARDPEFARQLKATQRVYKIAPSYDATNTLMADGLHSAQKIYRQGKQAFVSKYSGKPGFDPAIAADTWERAADTHAAVMAIVGDLVATTNANGVYALDSGSDAVADFPNLTNLFGNGDACDCEQCRSVFGAAAYLADGLMYLESRTASDGVTSVKTTLFDRRPDLGLIELTCPNTNTTLPYVDLACEVLEDRVAPWKLFDLPAALAPNFVKGPANAAVRAAFAAAAPPITLTATAMVSDVDHLGGWVIRDHDRQGDHTWRVRPAGGQLEVAILRQTRGTAEELAANPEYVNEAAYQVLAAAHYPMSLPFDLAAEEVAAYLGKVGVKRSAIMENFRGATPPNNPADIDIAAAHFGVAPAERVIIFVNDPIDTTQQFQYWGEATNAAAIAAMSHVDAFMVRTGLEYEELQTLLTLEFVNPGGATAIQHLDTSCDLSQKRIQPMNAPLLDRIHRFVRLWRKLGWKMWEVDLVIRNRQIGNGKVDNAFLLALYAFTQVREKLAKLTVEQVSALFDRINTQSKFTGQNSTPEPSLYEQLFLNKRMMDRLDPAFAIDTVTAADPLPPAVPPAAPDIAPDHLAPLLAATRVSDADLAILLGLIRPVADPDYAARHAYIDGKMRLGNLSFVYRNALLIKALGIKAKDWARLAYLLQANVFASPATLLDFLKHHERIKASGFSTDELGYLLAADLTVKPAEADKAISGMLTTLRKGLQTITAAAAAPIPTDTDDLIAFISAQLQTLGWDTARVTALGTLLKPEARAAAVADTFTFPTAITDVIPIAFNGETRALSFRGLMTDGQRTTLLTDAALAPVTGLADYQNAIAALFAAPRAAMKFYWPEFRTALKTLPSDVQFGTQLSTELAAKVSYDAERDQLVFFGVMTVAERDTLKGLSNNAAYVAAVQDLFDQPAGPITADRLWVLPADDLGTAASKLVKYAEATLSRNLVIQQFATVLKVTPAMSEQLLTTSKLFGVPKHPLLDDYLAASFAGSSAAVTAAAFPDLFNAYRFLHRVALVLGRTKAIFADLEWLRRTQPQTGVLDFATLPLAFDDTVPAIVSPEGLLDLARLMELHRAFSTPDLSLLDMLDRVISDGAYTNDLFAADVERLTTWPKADVQALTAANVLTAAYPAAYTHVAAWDRLVRCFDLLMRVNGGAANGLALAAPAMTVAVSQTLKQLLRGKYEVEQWLDISKSVQDQLRHRKRDSLVAYLLTRPMPADAPSHKWENANDLYAYYLIDVEMCACMQTSRIVQATNSKQLYVQRCFMGLEPKVRVSVEDDDAWKQWTWMKNYRVWEANRRVFVYPENYALPELKLDRSEIFKKLEDELLQNDVTKDNVETAFLHYLEKLDEVAQLEIAGTYYQENTRTLHVFGRTPGSEPHTYYYRQFIDSRRWTAWSKVECDIKSDYLVPLVANERLHLVWPEFREQPDEQGSINVPAQNAQSVSLDKPWKKMDVFLAVTEFRSGKWTPKKVAQQPVSAAVAYRDEFDKSAYIIIPVDLTWLPDGPFLLDVYNVNSYGGGRLFELAGCKGYPEPYEGDLPLVPILTRFQRDEMAYIKNVEDSTGDPLVPSMSFALTQKILDATPGLFRISYPQYMSFFDQIYFVVMAILMQAYSYGLTAFAQRRGFYLTLGTFYDWFYADKLRTFFVQHELVAPNGTRYFYQDLVAFTKELLKLMAEGQGQQVYEMLESSAKSGLQFKLLFNNFYHPLTCHITKQLYAKGVDGMLARETQFADKHFDFNAKYHPTPYVDPQYPQEIVDFAAGASYSQYNWELFYFAPLLVATRLSANQKFEDAMRWFHYIFDPTGGHDKDPLTNALAPAPQKYWITKPFYQRQAADYEAQRVQNLMNMLAANVGPGVPPPLVKELQDHIADWRNNPFDPHIVAQFRTVAYQKLTVMKYVDNLIAWGDQQFRQFTMESVNQATQLYVLAAEILGPRPHKVPPPVTPAPETFNEIEDKLDAFSNAMVELENFVPAVSYSLQAALLPVPPVPTLLYFCIPQNDQLVAYWDRVEDRLYKIRHCLDLDGVPRSLALFAPPIDPMALIRALAGGADLASAISGLDAPLPHYRFMPTLQKSNEFNADVKALGAALLVALEKKDAEALSRLRQTHELAVLNAARAVKEAQIEEQTRAIEGLQKNKEMITIRRDYYASRELVSAGEGAALAINTASLVVHGVGAVADVLGGVLAVIPDFQLGASGFGGSPHASAKTGGQSFSKAAELAARALYQTSTLLDKGAAITSTLAGYQRRMDDWQHQLTLASKELEQMDKQIAAAQIRIDNAKRELDNHDLGIANSKEIDAYFHDKYTNQELYEWMIGQISQTYFQSYQLAFDLAKRAERCFQFELGIENTSYIQFGYWDSLKSGLQAGEHLQLALRQLESAYLDANRREYECTKHVSLAIINPLALIKLKDGGSCVVDIPEELFDLDYPGHYFRRLKSVSLSLPCVAGPHTTVNCTLRLIRNMVRVNTQAGTQYEHNNDNGVFIDDTRFRESHLRVNAIATSTGQNDNGMFEMNFRDDRYLPFEGAGAVSTWRIELVADKSLRQFDYDTITDVILHLRYTAREDAGQFKDGAIGHLQSVLQNPDPTLKLRRMFDLRREFATEWYAFLHPAPGGNKTLTIQLTRDHFPALGKKDATIRVESISIAARTKSNGEMKIQVPPLGGLVAAQLTLAAAANTGDFATVTKKNIAAALDPTVPWEFRFRKSALQFNDLEADEIQECFLVIEYTLQP
jgi:hypothetical protein